jgi:hypothetical protein
VKQVLFTSTNKNPANILLHQIKLCRTLAPSFLQTDKKNTADIVTTENPKSDYVSEYFTLLIAFSIENTRYTKAFSFTAYSRLKGYIQQTESDE